MATNAAASASYGPQRGLPEADAFMSTDQKRLMDEPLFASMANVAARTPENPKIEEQIDQYHLLMVQQVHTIPKQQEHIAMAVQAAMAAAQAAAEVAAHMSRAMRPPEPGSF